MIMDTNLISSASLLSSSLSTFSINPSYETSTEFSYLDDQLSIAEQVAIGEIQNKQYFLTNDGHQASFCTQLSRNKLLYCEH